MNPYIELLGSALSIWNHIEKNKYLDRYTKLKKEYYEESNKPMPDNSVLDNIEFDLFLLGNSFNSTVKGSQTGSVSG